MDITKLSVPIGVVIVGIGSLWSGYTYVESTYAKNDQVVLVEMRLDQKIQGDRISQIQERQWKIKDRYGDDLKQAPEIVKEEFRALEKQMEELTRQLTTVQESIQRQQYLK